MNVLVACEMSGIVREEFRKLGHNAWSCDLLDTEIPGQHYKCDVREVLYKDWDLIIAHPPCDYLANSGNRWFYHPEDKHKPPQWRRPHPLYADRPQQRKDAVHFFKVFRSIKIKCPVLIENPIPNNYLIEQVGFYHQIIRPWQFGHKEMKATCLWQFGLPKLTPTNIVGPPPKDKEERKKWEKVFREPPGPKRKINRSRTYPGIAKAIAEQYSNYIMITRSSLALQL